MTARPHLLPRRLPLWAASDYTGAVKLAELSSTIDEGRAWLRPWRKFRRRLRKHAGLGDALARVAAVEGFLSDDEGKLLYELGRRARDGVIVEIGTYRGKSTVALALGARVGGHAPVYAIDPLIPFTGLLGGQQGPQDKALLFKNLLLAGVTEDVWLLQTTSAQAAKGWTAPIALLWIDGDHAYEGVRTDVDCWAPFVIPGGTVAFDDTLLEDWGPRKVVGELLASGGWERETMVGKITVLRRQPAGA